MSEHFKNILTILHWFPRIWIGLIIIPMFLMALFFLSPIILLLFFVSRRSASFMIDNIIESKNKK